MWKTFVLIVVLALTVCCLGQTFQYSRGWTNGKRSDSHLGEDIEMNGDENLDKKLDRCLGTLQRVMQNSFIRRALLSANGKFTRQHNLDAADDLFAVDAIGGQIKREISKERF